MRCSCCSVVSSVCLTTKNPSASRTNRPRRRRPLEDAWRARLPRRLLGTASSSESEANRAAMSSSSSEGGRRVRDLEDCLDALESDRGRCVVKRHPHDKHQHRAASISTTLLSVSMGTTTAGNYSTMAPTLRLAVSALPSGSMQCAARSDSTKPPSASTGSAKPGSCATLRSQSSAALGAAAGGHRRRSRR